VKTYTDGISTLSAGLSGVKSSGALTGNPAEATLNALIDGLATAAAGGGTLSSQTSTALSGVKTGIIELDKGADALDDAGQELLKDPERFAKVSQTSLREPVISTKGMVELAEGAREFADGVAEGADDLRESAGTMPS
jgi:putative membrane protein